MAACSNRQSLRAAVMHQNSIAGSRLWCRTWRKAGVVLGRCVGDIPPYRTYHDKQVLKLNSATEVGTARPANLQVQGAYWSEHVHREVLSCEGGEQIAVITRRVRSAILCATNEMRGEFGIEKRAFSRNLLAPAPTRITLRRHTPCIIHTQMLGR